MAYVREGQRPDSRLPGTHKTTIVSRDAERELAPEPVVTREPVREHERARSEKATFGTITGGASLETLGGVTAVVLAIIALTGIAPLTLGAIATIAIGVGLLTYGLAIAARWRETLRTKERAEAGTASGIEMLAGAAGIVLGILMLVGIMPELLLAIAAIVFGGALMVGAAGQTQLASATRDRKERFDQTMRRTMKGSGGIMVVVGAAAIVLAVLGLLGILNLLTLTLVALLAIGAALAISGLANAAEFGHRLREAT